MSKILLIDTWEAGGEIDEPLLTANDVSGMLVRINDISGGHHMDSNFASQWAQAKDMFVRIVYFVYNPWKDGQANFDWLNSHIPLECGAVALDVEVRYTGYLPSAYASEFDKFYKLVRAKWNTIIYTGEWFLEYLSYWPKDALYWWAAYPDAFYHYENLTWDTLRTRLNSYDRPSNESKVPGILGMWQFTGDRIILPGCPKRMDVNVWYGSKDELRAFVNEKPTDSLPVGDTLLSERKYYDGLTEKQIQMETPHGRTVYNLTTIETKKVKKFFISPAPQYRMWIPKYLEQYKLHAAIQLDGWTTPPLVTFGRNASEGQPYGPSGTTESYWISKENVFSATKPDALWHQGSYQNRLIKDGVIPPIDKSTSDIRARTAFGWNKEQTLVYFLTVDGGDHWSNEGLNFQDTAKILLDLGCWQGYMHDGGASTAKAINDNGNIVIIGNTCGADSKITLEGYPYDKPLERVPNVLGVIMNTEPIIEPPTGEITMITMTPKENNERVRGSHNTYAPILQSVNAGMLLGGNEKWVALADGDQVKKGDEWVFVTHINGVLTSKPGWVAHIHLGIERCNNYSDGTIINPPPPSTDNFPDEVGITIDNVTKQYIRKP